MYFLIYKNVKTMSAVFKTLRASRVDVDTRIERLVKLVNQDTSAFSELFEAILHPDPSVRSVASQASERITREKPELLQGFKNMLVYKVTKVEQREVKEAAIPMLTRMPISPREYSTVFNILAGYLEDKESAVALKALEGIELMLSLSDRADNDNTPHLRPSVLSLLEKIAGGQDPQLKESSRKLLDRINGVTTGELPASPTSA